MVFHSAFASLSLSLSNSFPYCVMCIALYSLTYHCASHLNCGPSFVVAKKRATSECERERERERERRISGRKSEIRGSGEVRADSIILSSFCLGSFVSRISFSSSHFFSRSAFSKEDTCGPEKERNKERKEPPKKRKLMVKHLTGERETHS